MRHRVELIFDKDCPNAEPTRQRLRDVMIALGQRPEWMEWDRADRAAPPSAARFASPTVLVDGRDVGESAPVQGAACRVYRQPDGTFSGAPAVDALRQALAAAESR